MAKWVSLIVKFGALIFIVFVPLQYAIQLQLLGGVWIIQTMPAVLIGLYTRWFNAWALLIGWAAGTFAGTYMAASVNFASTYSLTIGGWTFPGYIALYALILNLVTKTGEPVQFIAMIRRSSKTVSLDKTDVVRGGAAFLFAPFYEAWKRPLLAELRRVIARPDTPAG